MCSRLKKWLKPVAAICYLEDASVSPYSFQLVVVYDRGELATGWEMTSYQIRKKQTQTCSLFLFRTRSPWPCHSCLGRWSTSLHKVHHCCEVNRKSCRGCCFQSSLPLRMSAHSTAALPPADYRHGPPASDLVRGCVPVCPSLRLCMPMY